MLHHISRTRSQPRAQLIGFVTNRSHSPLRSAAEPDRPARRKDLERAMKKTIEPSFRSKAERESEKALMAQYRELGNPEVVDAVRQQQAAQGQRQPQQG